MIVGHFSSLQLLLFLFNRAASIGLLKEGRMIDDVGREYKSLRHESDGVERTAYPQVDGSQPVRIECTDSSMTVKVNPDYFKRGRFAPFGDLFLGEARHWQNSKCQLLPANGLYVITVELQECGSNSTVNQTCYLYHQRAVLFETGTILNTPIYLQEAGDSLIYSNKLFHVPALRHPKITRLTSAVISVACHYKR